ncbi:hypothetical protein [Ferrimicrobium acidiphilum]|uniref:hypothetical protein n=1 Tax=Ferrimicrobium acidiphilum TaxID=121039 RepID=UPI0023F006C5|nr:hypothetical protein [Ferrimicrobium acidiphilum]
MIAKQFYQIRDTIAFVSQSPARRFSWIGLATMFALAYSLLLPFDFTQQIAFSNWAYLDPYIVGWSITLGAVMSLVVMVQITAMRDVVSAGSRSLTGIAFIASLVPSFLCCTPIVPTLLALVGFSSLGLYNATGGIQHFFATQQTLFLSASLAVLLISLWWSAHRFCHASCRFSTSKTDPESTNQSSITEVHQ